MRTFLVVSGDCKNVDNTRETTHFWNIQLFVAFRNTSPPRALSRVSRIHDPPPALVIFICNDPSRCNSPGPQSRGGGTPVRFRHGATWGKVINLPNCPINRTFEPPSKHPRRRPGPPLPPTPRASAFCRYPQILPPSIHACEWCEMLFIFFMKNIQFRATVFCSFFLSLTKAEI